jgi:hypothetical protein
MSYRGYHEDLEPLPQAWRWLAVVFILSCVAVMLCSCGVMSPMQQETAIQVLGQMRAAGTITEEQYQALLQALLSAGSAHFWEQVVTAVGGAAMAYAGVQVRRKIDHSQSRKAREVASRN